MYGSWRNKLKRVSIFSIFYMLNKNFGKNYASTNSTTSRYCVSLLLYYIAFNFKLTFAQIFSAEFSEWNIFQIFYFPGIYKGRNPSWMIVSRRNINYQTSPRTKIKYISRSIFSANICNGKWSFFGYS